MRWGLLARSETDRGLGIQTFAMHENLKPDKTLVVLAKSGFAQHPENYLGCETVEFRVEHGIGVFPEQQIRDWWSDLDAVVSVETFYDWRLIEWAKTDGVKTIVHGNPEFWMATNPQPDTWWWPTEWRLKHLPRGPVVPVPVGDDVPFTAADPEEPGNLRLLHIAGNAMEDRNGTLTCLHAMKRVQTGAQMDIYAQSAIPSTTHLRVRALKPVDDRWTMYKGQHALVMPRRYGGLCLPVNEALASGLMVIMSDCSPNTRWPICPVQSDPSKIVQMQTGPVQTFETHANALANTIKHYAISRQAIHLYQARAQQWAAENRWSVLKQRYYDEIDIACRK